MVHCPKCKQKIKIVAVEAKVSGGGKPVHDPSETAVEPVDKKRSSVPVVAAKTIADDAPAFNLPVPEPENSSSKKRLAIIVGSLIAFLVVAGLIWKIILTSSNDKSSRSSSRETVNVDGESSNDENQTGNPVGPGKKERRQVPEPPFEFGSNDPTSWFRDLGFTLKGMPKEEIQNHSPAWRR